MKKIPTQKIPEGWKQDAISNVAEIVMGQSPSSSAYNETGEGLPLIQGNYDIRKDRTINRIWTTEITKTAAKGDIVLTVRAPVGVVGKADGEICIGRGVCAIKSNHIDFIWHYLKYFEHKWGSLEQGSTFTAVNSTDIKKLKINLPLPIEQQRIVIVLETWDKAIESLTKKIEIKKQIKNGLMQELLTGNTRLRSFTGKWESRKIREIGKVVTGNTPSMKNTDYYGGNNLWATAFDFNGVYIKDTQIKLSESGRKVARIVPKGSVLVTCIASIGKNAIADTQMAFNQQINAIVPYKDFNSEFIYYLIENSLHKFWKVAGGGALAMISKSVFENIKLDFPTLEEQITIADTLRMADNQISSFEKKLSLLEDQKKYLLNNLITGAIRTPETLKINN